MSGNLIVLKDKVLVFSNYYRKNNGLPVEIPLSVMMTNIIVSGSFNIPVSSQRTFLINPFGKYSPNAEGVKMLPGGCLVSIAEGSLSDISLNPNGEYEIINVIPTNDDNFYCRSSNYNLESAATVGHFLQFDAVKIYTEANKALRNNIYPFVSIEIKDLTEAVSVLKEYGLKKDNTQKSISYMKQFVRSKFTFHT